MLPETPLCRRDDLLRDFLAPFRTALEFHVVAMSDGTSPQAYIAVVPQFPQVQEKMAWCWAAPALDTKLKSLLRCGCLEVAESAFPIQVAVSRRAMVRIGLQVRFGLGLFPAVLHHTHVVSDTERGNIESRGNYARVHGDLYVASFKLYERGRLMFNA
jgi:hypothetical protein